MACRNITKDVSINHKPHASLHFYYIFELGAIWGTWLTFAHSYALNMVYLPRAISLGGKREPFQFSTVILKWFKTALVSRQAKFLALFFLGKRRLLFYLRGQHCSLKRVEFSAMLRSIESAENLTNLYLSSSTVWQTSLPADCAGER